ncbi:MAG TPA: D-cysteine desulfhydrase family protein [Anaerolinea sp.]|nr:D-cysteine desulfhydrase family protein [Anaerolinea sp.]
MMPRLCLANLPTPVEHLPRLSAHLGLRVLVKRDDLTGVAMGGNKTRKLEYLLAEALSTGARTLVTVGAAQSNHCRQTAALAARLGLACILVLSGDESAAPSGNLLLDRMFGAEIVWTTREQRSEALKAAFDRAWEAGRRPYLIPLGASNGLGAAAYSLAFDEMVEQTGNESVDWIVVASSSGGTQAGLALGARRRAFQGKVLGISIDHPAADLAESVAFLANEAASRLGTGTRVESRDVMVNADYLGGGYGVMGAAEREAIDLFARQEGLLLDPVYTGRAAAGMIDLARSGFFRPGETLLFWHTGGTPALFAEPYQGMLLGDR